MASTKLLKVINFILLLVIMAAWYFNIENHLNIGFLIIATAIINQIKNKKIFLGWLIIQSCFLLLIIIMPSESTFVQVLEMKPVFLSN
jgi:hypothetical protein